MERLLQMANGDQYPVKSIEVTQSIYDNRTYRVTCDYWRPSVSKWPTVNSTTLATFKTHAEAQAYVLTLANARIVN